MTFARLLRSLGFSPVIPDAGVTVPDPAIVFRSRRAAPVIADPVSGPITAPMPLNFGQRLREERKRLGMTQSALAAVGGVSKHSQILYEKHGRPPTADYLAGIAAAGVDILYIVTGRREHRP